MRRALRVAASTVAGVVLLFAGLVASALASHGGPGLNLFLGHSPDPVTVGQELTFGLTLSNAGPDHADTVALTDTLPSGVDLVSVGADCSDAGGGSVGCMVFNLGVGQSWTSQVVVRPNTPGTITNQASAVDEANPSNSDSAADTIEVLDLPPPPPPATPCIIVRPATPVDFGTRSFSTSGNVVRAQGSPDVQVENCGSGAAQIHARGTAATGGGTTWTLSAAADPCAGAANVFGLSLGALALTTNAQLLGSLAPGTTRTETPTLTMPCTGSGGAGSTLQMQLVFTATT